jgi:2-polyprenyl-6-hydroxyphenyl methylase/3-demethylubiquinone-9 3-methyltransferase
MPQSASIDKDEIAMFSHHAGDWWNPDGALRPLHKLNPVRLEYIRERICGHFERENMKGLSILDIGCGGGLLCEPLTRMGAAVTGLDASNEAIAAAKAHAIQSCLKVNYHCGSAEAFAGAGRKFDVVTALEILEHVADIGSLLSAAARLLKPKGILILSTVNRTPKSFLLGIIAAEYVLRWVPRGTHNWRKFIRPSELASHLEQVGLQADDITGVIYNPLDDAFILRQTAVDVNYMMSAVHG